MSDFQWSAVKEKAALLVAQDELSDEAICREVGIRTRQTLHAWKQHPDFQARVDGLIAEFKALVRRRGIADLERRVDALNDRWKRMRTVIEERAEEMQDEAPGGGTGLLVRTYKSIGSGESAREVEEYAVDTGLLRELREHEKQAAQELRQWVETSVVGEVTVKILKNVAMDEL